MDPLSALLALLTALVEQESLVIAGASLEQRLEYARLSLAHRERVMTLLSPQEVTAPSREVLVRGAITPQITPDMTTTDSIVIRVPDRAVQVCSIAAPSGLGYQVRTIDVHDAITPQIAPDMTTKDSIVAGGVTYAPDGHIYRQVSPMVRKAESE